MSKGELHQIGISAWILVRHDMTETRNWRRASDAAAKVGHTTPLFTLSWVQDAGVWGIADGLGCAWLQSGVGDKA